jgi:hypothetical protein
MRTENVHKNLDGIHGFLSRSIFVIMALKVAQIAIYRRLALTKADDGAEALRNDGATG